MTHQRLGELSGDGISSFSWRLMPRAFGANRALLSAGAGAWIYFLFEVVAIWRWQLKLLHTQTGLTGVRCGSDDGQPQQSKKLPHENTINRYNNYCLVSSRFENLETVVRVWAEILGSQVANLNKFNALQPKWRQESWLHIGLFRLLHI